MNIFPRIYRGIDYATILKNQATVFVTDDGHRLKAHQSMGGDGEVARTAVDCPFGTSAGFMDLLAGRSPRHSDDHFQTRETERKARERVKGYGVTARWAELTAAEKGDATGVQFFNGGSHVQPTLAMRIVPACLNFLLEQGSLKNASTKERLGALVGARRGEGPIVEAHPRLFLYSAVERINQQAVGDLPPKVLGLAAQYRSKPKDQAPARRRELYRSLRSNPAWMGAQARHLEPAAPPDWLVANDHVFDAWLCALTAWAHNNSETLDWSAAGIPREIVDIEGHMLLLST